MKHIIRIDLTVDEDPVDENVKEGGYDYSYTHHGRLPLARKYAALVKDKLGVDVNPETDIEVFPVRVGKVEAGTFRCPNGHDDSIHYFEDVYSRRYVHPGIDGDGDVVVSGDSNEGDGEADVLEFECDTCGVTFTAPDEVTYHFV